MNTTRLSTRDGNAIHGELRQLFINDSNPFPQQVIQLITTYETGDIVVLSLLDKDSNSLVVRQKDGHSIVPAPNSFCGRTLHLGETFIIENALEDEDFRDNGFVVGPMKIRSYLGTVVPIPNLGKRLTLCVMSREATHFDPPRIKRFESAAVIVGQVLLQALEFGRNKEQLKEAQSELNTLTHDLRNPFNGILNLSKELHTKIGLAPDNQSKEMAGLLTRCAESAFDLVSDAEAQMNEEYTASGSNSTPPEKLYRLIHRVKSLLEPSANAKHIQITGIVSDAINAPNNGRKLEIILRNLLANSIKFGYPECEIRIDAFESEKSLEIQVTDRGLGMDASTIDAISSGNVSRITTPGTYSEKGTGTGISLCAAALKEVGGTLQFDSCPQVGTVALIKLPKQEKT